MVYTGYSMSCLQAKSLLKCLCIILLKIHLSTNSKSMWMSQNRSISTWNTAPHMIAESPPHPRKPPNHSRDLHIPKSPTNLNANPTSWAGGATNNMLNVEFTTPASCKTRRTPKPTRSPSIWRSQMIRRPLKWSRSPQPRKTRHKKCKIPVSNPILTHTCS